MFIPVPFTESSCPGGRTQCLQEWAAVRGRFSTPIAGQQLTGALCKHSPHFSPFPLHTGYHHTVVSGSGMPHPSDDRCLGSLIDRNPFGPGDRPTADRGGVVSHGTSKSSGEFGVV